MVLVSFGYAGEPLPGDRPRRSSTISTSLHASLVSLLRRRLRHDRVGSQSA